MWTFDIDHPLARNRTEAGGKGVGLALLVEAGLPVPPGFVVRSAAMTHALGETPPLPAVWSDEWARAEAARRGALLLAAPFPAGLDEEVRARLRALGDGPVAVRSSAEDEDGLTRSAAGQHATVLGARGPDEVLAAIRRCWKSLHGHRAAVYRARTGGVPFPAGGAVVVQRQIAAESAGVIFTDDPFAPGWRGRPAHRSRERRIVIEAFPGPGSAVADGGARVDRFELEVDDGGDGDGANPRMADAPPAGSATSLDAASLERLGGLALRAERALGRPADVEWVRAADRVDGVDGFHLVQLRPITPVARNARRRAEILWTQRFSGERWTEPATTLGWSIVEPALRRYTHWEWASRRYLGGTGPARLHAGIPYFNVTIFRHLLLRTPWTPTPEFVLELFPSDEAEELRRRRWIFPTPGLVLRILAEALLRGRWRGHRWAWFTNPRDWDRLAAGIEAALASGRTPADARAAMKEIERLRGWLDRYVGVHVWSLLWANLFYQALGNALERFGGPAALRARAALVVGGEHENRTMETNAAVRALAEIAAADASLATCLREAPDGLAALRRLADTTGPAADRLRAGLAALLGRYGHRSRATWEVFSRRWRDEPELVLEMVRALLRAEGGHAARRTDAAREQAERALDGRVAPAARPLLRWLLGRARVFSHLRENQRFVFDRLMLAIREACFAAGGRLERTGVLLEAGDVVHLSIDELAAIVRGTLPAPEARRRVAERARERERNRLAWTPTFLHDLAGGDGGGDRAIGVHRGVGISPGRHTGPVRIARTLADVAALRKGEVLVVKATEPGWTAYFGAAGGLVTELGGLLSHGAVVAREYGLPAVANVEDAMTVFRDGERVTVDGERGLVWRA